MSRVRGNSFSPAMIGIEMQEEINQQSFTRAMWLTLVERGVGYIYPDEMRGSDFTVLAFNKSHPGFCQYEFNGKPACMIGLALNYLGYRESDYIEFAEKPAHKVLGYLGVKDRKLQEAARLAQEIQDNGGTWGAAFTAYQKALA